MVAFMVVILGRKEPERVLEVEELSVRVGICDRRKHEMD